jgi:hypothetical protein
MIAYGGSRGIRKGRGRSHAHFPLPPSALFGASAYGGGS